MQVHHYLNFNGRTEEALAFYSKAIGARTGMMMRMKDAPDQGNMSYTDGEKILHSDFTIGSTMLMASDGYCTGEAAQFTGVTLSLVADSEADAQRLFKALGEGGKVTMPMGPTFFSPAFGMLEDRFGVPWMVLVSTTTGQQPG